MWAYRQEAYLGDTTVDCMAEGGIQMHGTHYIDHIGPWNLEDVGQAARSKAC